MCKIIPNEEVEKEDNNEASTERISRYDNISESDTSAQRDSETNTEENVEEDPQESNIESGNEEEAETKDESLGFEDIAREYFL